MRSLCPKLLLTWARLLPGNQSGIQAKLTAHQVNIVTGEATVIDKNAVKCGEEIYECENLLLCTGSDTFIPPIPGVDGVDYWTHRDALDNKEVPASLAIVAVG